MALNERQLKFVDEYLIDLNAAKAAIRAGYSERSARSIGQENLTKPDIQKAIQERLEARSKRTEISQDRVLLEIARLAFNDPRRAYDENGNLLPVKDWPDEVAAAIKSVKITELKDEDEDGNIVVVGTTNEVSFWDKGKQLELAARHLGMLNDKLFIGDVDKLAERLGRARSRVGD
ncbi:MAG: terminase small subunit [Methylobacter sp.]|jgi:phage terminase small subunit